MLYFANLWQISNYVKHAIHYISFCLPLYKKIVLNSVLALNTLNGGDGGVDISELEARRFNDTGVSTIINRSITYVSQLSL
jgi:hypothetical protein